MVRLNTSYSTDIGKVRRHNEDSCAVFNDLGLSIVCDGMGGHDAGEVASAIAVESIAEAVKLGRSLDDAVSKAHQDILAAPSKKRGRAGMGTTVVALQAKGRNYKVCWVGDSRVYLWNGVLRQLTHDHSYVQNLIDAGVITEDEAKKHPQRNVVTQALGAGDAKELDIGVVSDTFQQGDLILLCSDGLTGELDDHEISAVLQQRAPLPETVDQLMQASLDKGGKDNITIVLIEYSSPGFTAPRSVTIPNPAV